jgi:DNA-binding beta-propeller fold protein YncE
MNIPAKIKLGILVIFMGCTTMACAPVIEAAPNNGGGDKSDLNSDGVVDIFDLNLFSINYLETDVTLVDWCAFYDATKAGEDFEGESTKYYAKNFKMLLAFIYEDFDCGNTDPPPPPPPPPPEFEPIRLVRIGQATDGSGDFYFSDARSDSVFVYDSNLQPKAEISDFAWPLGVAMDSRGYILIGNDGRKNVEVFNPETGNLHAVFGQGILKMPTAITIGPDGLIYVTDSRSHNVKVFDIDYNLIRTIGSGGQGTGELDFPVDTLVLTYNEGSGDVQEVLVADQGNSRIQIYDLEGNYLRTIKSGCGSFSCRPPEFRKLQALALDSQGRVHALDNFKALVSIIDPGTGAFITSYGEYGEGEGFLRVPLDLLITDADEAIITSGDGDRIEVIAIPQ